jgi:RNA polymerase sigma-70 factor (ECF subfamily)
VSETWDGTVGKPGAERALGTVAMARGRPLVPSTKPKGDTSVVQQKVATRPRGDLERVFRAEYPRVVAVARRVLVDDHAAEDVAQEVFLGFARSDVEESAARGWLAVAAVHIALNSVRASRRRSGREKRVEADPALGRPQPGGDPAEDAVRSLERAEVRRALAALPRPQAVALVLRHSGVSYADIADALGIAASGVGTTVRRAEAALRKELTSDDPSF